MLPAHRKLLDACYLVPKAQHRWFSSNGMHSYNANNGNALDDVGNLITLTCDIHRHLDGASLVLVPANDGYVVHYLEAQPDDFYAGLHRAPVHLHDRVRNQFLYARFAYNILALVKPLILSETWRRVPLPNWAMPLSGPAEPEERYEQGQ